MPTHPDAVALVALRDEPLSVDEVLDAVRHPACGGIAVFVGVVRDHDHGDPVTSLDYEAHPSAVDTMRSVLEDVADRSPGVRVAAVHRTGAALRVGDLAVVVAAAAPHRGEAFDAAREVIDTIKSRTPIWKHQHLGDGSTEWVGLP
jgi:molybdopterin synthase catalytic subunit